ncbi:MAG: DUF99 family protein [Candidatus Aenigmatarchaeota archaeon]
MPIRKVKDEIRILGWDDASFDTESSGKIPLVGSVVRGGKPYLDGVLVEEVEVDGFDATETIIHAANGTKHKGQLRIMMLDGITFAGFNTVDIQEISRKTELPVVVVTRKDIDFKGFREAMKKLPRFEERWKCVEKAGELKELGVSGGKVYFQHTGIEEDKARRVLEISASKGRIPEPIRISHLVATAIQRGESVGGA